MGTEDFDPHLSSPLISAYSRCKPGMGLYSLNLGTGGVAPGASAVERSARESALAGVLQCGSPYSVVGRSDAEVLGSCTVPG
jgi:hypothetical protein